MVLGENKKLRFGCHNFLNAKPLTYPLEAGKIVHPFNLIFDTPANLAVMLSEAKLDLAIIPSIEYARIKGLSLLRDFSISSRGKIGTVLLFSNKELRDVKKVAVDKSSRTSIAMLKILFIERFGTDPVFVPCEPQVSRMMELADAGLIIGDNAFKVNTKKYFIYDLGEQWFILCGQTFVHAVIAVRDGIVLNGADNIIRKAKEMGLESIGKITESESERLNIRSKTCIDYLTNRISYKFDKKETCGLKHFFKLAKMNHLIDKEPQLRFYGS